jgi:hypothetical protein
VGGEETSQLLPVPRRSREGVRYLERASCARQWRTTRTSEGAPKQLQWSLSDVRLGACGAPLPGLLRSLSHVEQDVQDNDAIMYWYAYMIKHEMRRERNHSVDATP